MKKLFSVLLILSFFSGIAQIYDSGSVFNFRKKITPFVFEDLGDNSFLIGGPDIDWINGEKSNGLVLLHYSGKVLKASFGDLPSGALVNNFKYQNGFILVSITERSRNKIILLEKDGSFFKSTDQFYNENGNSLSGYLQTIKDFEFDENHNLFIATGDPGYYKIYKVDDSGLFHLFKDKGLPSWNSVKIYSSQESDKIVVQDDNGLEIINPDGSIHKSVDLPSLDHLVLKFHSKIELLSTVWTDSSWEVLFNELDLNGDILQLKSFGGQFQTHFVINFGSSIAIEGGQSLEKYSLISGELEKQFAFYNTNSCRNGISLSNGGAIFSGYFDSIDGESVPGLALMDSDGQLIKTNLNFQSSGYPSHMIKVGDKLMAGGRFNGYKNNSSSGLVVMSPSGKHLKSFEFDHDGTNEICDMTSWNEKIYITTWCSDSPCNSNMKVFDLEMNQLEPTGVPSRSIAGNSDYLFQNGSFRFESTFLPMKRISRTSEETLGNVSFIASGIWSDNPYKNLMVVKDNLIYRAGRSPEQMHGLTINDINFQNEYKLSFTNQIEEGEAIVEVPDGVIVQMTSTLYKVSGLEIDPTFVCPSFPLYGGRKLGTIWSLGTYGDVLFVGGDFATVNNIEYPGIVALSSVTGEVIDSISFPLKSGSEVYTIFVFGTDIYLGGKLVLEGQPVINQRTTSDISDYHVTFARFSMDPNFVITPLEIDTTSEVLGAKGVHEEMVIFPNPTEEKITFRFDSPKVGTYSIFSLAGQEIEHGTLENNSTVTIKGPKGIYILRAAFNDGTHSEFKVMKTD